VALPHILVTGASGFIGSAVVEELIARNCNFVCIGQKPPLQKDANWTHVDLEKDSEVDQYLVNNAPSLILHLAWIGIPDLSEEMSERNYQMSWKFIQKLLRFGAKRIVLAGSCLEYGQSEGQVDEESPLVDPAPFGRIKNKLFQSALSESRKFSCKVLNSRIFFSYGSGQRSGSLVPSLYRSITSGQAPSIRSPNAAQDFIEVTDVATGLVEMLLNESAEEGIYNIGSGKLTSVVEIAGLLSEKLGFSGENKPKIQSKGVYADITKLKKLGWSPKLSIEAGLERYIVHQQIQEKI
jgi:nucleoside-diphosphate-sugar epimerase